MNNRILIVDNEIDYQKKISRFLNKRGLVCDTASNVDTARELLENGHYAGCFMDMVLQPTNIAWYANTELSNDGLLLAKEMKTKGIRTIFVMLSGGLYDMRIDGFLNINKGQIDMAEILQIARNMSTKGGAKMSDILIVDRIELGSKFRAKIFKTQAEYALIRKMSNLFDHPFYLIRKDVSSPHGYAIVIQYKGSYPFDAIKFLEHDKEIAATLHPKALIEKRIIELIQNDTSNNLDNIDIAGEVAREFYCTLREPLLAIEELIRQGVIKSDTSEADSFNRGIQLELVTGV